MYILTLICIIVLIPLYKLLKIYSYWSNKGVTHVSLLQCFNNVSVCVFRTTPSADIIQNLYEKYKNERYLGFYQYLQPILLIKDPELIKDITMTDCQAFIDHNDFIPSTDLNTLWSRNLFSTSNENGWKEMRSIFTPFFTGSKLAMMLPFMKECSENCLNDLNLNEGTISVNIKDLCLRYTNDVIASTAFGVICNSFKHKNNEFFEMTKHVINYTGMRGLNHIAFSTFPKLMRMLNIQSSRSKTSEFFKNVYLDSVKIRSTENVHRPDIINSLMKIDFDKDHSPSERQNSNLRFTEEDFIGQIILFVVAGVESTTHTIASIFYELASNPNVLEKLQEEISHTLDEYDNTASYEALTSMKYLDNVIKECLRLHPATVVLDRKCVQSYTIKAKLPHEKDIHLKRGDWVWIPHKAIQTDEIHYPESHKFDPDRFNDKSNPLTFLTFGLGPRSCIGLRFAMLEIKTIVATILQNYNVLPRKYKRDMEYHDEEVLIDLKRKH